MLPDRVSNPGPLTYESGALPIALRGPADFGTITDEVQDTYKFSSLVTIQLSVIHSKEGYRRFCFFVIFSMDPAILINSKEPINYRYIETMQFYENMLHFYQRTHKRVLHMLIIQFIRFELGHYYISNYQTGGVYDSLVNVQRHIF